MSSLEVDVPGSEDGELDGRVDVGPPPADPVHSVPKLLQERGHVCAASRQYPSVQVRLFTGGPEVQSQNQLPQSSALAHATLVAPAGRRLALRPASGFFDDPDGVVPPSPNELPPPPDEHAGSTEKNSAGPNVSKRAKVIMMPRGKHLVCLRENACKTREKVAFAPRQ